MPRQFPPLIDRFWSKVDRSAGDDACWLWVGAIGGTAARGYKGYGNFWMGRPIAAHRASYLFNVGEIPDGLCVCHKCDNPICVNPAHLFIGTQTDNIRDMTRKGRHRSPLADACRARTHCSKGHEYSAENTAIYNGKRACRECGRASCRLQWQKRPKRGRTPKTHCPYGHEYTAENTWYNHRNTVKGCKECRRLRAAAWRLEHPGDNARFSAEWRRRRASGGATAKS